MWRNHPDRDLRQRPKVGKVPWTVLLPHRNKKKVQEELDKALSVLIEHDVDMILVEYFFYIQVTKGDLITSPCACRRWSGP